MQGVQPSGSTPSSGKGAWKGGVHGTLDESYTAEDGYGYDDDRYVDIPSGSQHYPYSSEDPTSNLARCWLVTMFGPTR